MRLVCACERRSRAPSFASIVVMPSCVDWTAVSPSAFYTDDDEIPKPQRQCDDPGPRGATVVARGRATCWKRRNSLIVASMAKCDLCELKEYTPWYARFTQPFKFALLECDSCDTPMAVLGDHRKTPTDEERAFMIEA